MIKAININIPRSTKLLSFITYEKEYNTPNEYILWLQRVYFGIKKALEYNDKSMFKVAPVDFTATNVSVHNNIRILYWYDRTVDIANEAVKRFYK